jgi:hypothetical protein
VDPRGPGQAAGRVLPAPAPSPARAVRLLRELADSRSPGELGQVVCLEALAPVRVLAECCGRTGAAVTSGTAAGRDPARCAGDLGHGGHVHYAQSAGPCGARLLDLAW